MSVAQLFVGPHYVAPNMNELVAFIGAVSHVANVGKTLLQAHTQAERDAVRIEFSDALIAVQGKIAEVQTSHYALLEAHEALKKQLATYDRWEQERARYALQELVPGVLAYRLKTDEQPGEPQHWLCPTCYDERKKTILQRAGKGSGTFECGRGHPPLLTDEYV